MSKFVGRRGNVAIGRESTRGVVPSTLFWLPFSKMSFDDKTVTVREKQGLGKIADGDSSYVTQLNAEGDVESEVYDKALGCLLTGVFGANSTPSGGGPYTHTYTLTNTNQHQSLSVVYQDPDQTKVFPNAMIDNWKMTVDQNGIVQHAFGFKSKVSRDWSTLTANYTSLGSKFLHQHLSFKLASTIGGLSAATGISLKKLEVEIKKNAMFDSVLGTVEPEDVLNQQLSVDINFELLKTDDTYRQLELAGTYKAMEIKLTNGASSILTLQLPRVSFDKWEQDRKLDDIVSQKITGHGNYDAANALDIISTITLVNQQASY